MFFLKRNTVYTIGLEIPNMVGYNIPVGGWTIEEMYHGKITISSTENQARINITDSNLIYLMEYGNFNKKTYSEECIVVKEGDRFRLIPINSKIFQDLYRVEKTPRLVIGATFRVNHEDKEENLIYLGKYYFSGVYFQKIKNNEIEILYDKLKIARFSYNKRFIFLNESGEIISFYKKTEFTLIEKVDYEGAYKDFEYRKSIIFRSLIKQAKKIISEHIKYKKVFFYIYPQIEQESVLESDIEKYYKEIICK